MKRTVAEYAIICSMGLIAGMSTASIVAGYINRADDVRPITKRMTWELEIDACRRLAGKYGVPDDRIDFPIDRAPDGKAARHSIRVDLLSDTHAIEVDWSHKHSEAVGQSELYAIRTGRRAGIILLIKNPDSETEHRYVDRCKLVARHYGIDVWTEQAEKVMR